MSMVGNFLLVNGAELEELLRAPEGVTQLLGTRVYEVDQAEDYVDVDKAWHALHFLLTGTAWEGEAPLDFIAAGGAPVGDEDVGYGPARALRPNDVAALAEALAGVTSKTLLDRYDGARMDELEIYPQGWRQYDPRGGDEFGYYSGAYEDVAALVRKGAEHGRGLLVWIS